jgi:hypothetical protein
MVYSYQSGQPVQQGRTTPPEGVCATGIYKQVLLPNLGWQGKMLYPLPTHAATPR